MAVPVRRVVDTGEPLMECRHCSKPLFDLHGHYICVQQSCPLVLQTQEDCCQGETADG